jgi:hypothetical protein
LAASEDMLREKAMKRMTMDGISRKQAKEIVHEMPRLFASPKETVEEEDFYMLEDDERAMLEVLFIMPEAAFSEGVQNRVYCYRVNLQRVKDYFYWALKSPL